MLTMACSGFELPKFVQTAFKKLQSDVQLTTDVTLGEFPLVMPQSRTKFSLGDYQTKLEYTQSNVPTGTDDSLDFILPILAQPIVQKIVTASILGFVPCTLLFGESLTDGTSLVQD